MYRIFRKIKILFRRLYIKLFWRRINIGANFNFRKRLEINCSKEGRIVIGNNVFFNNDCSINSHIGIYIGNDCIFGENVKIYDHNHRFISNGMKIAKQGFSGQEIRIGNDCWIASNVILLPGTTIGNHVVIGAGCIISGEIESNTKIKVQQNQVVEQIRVG